MTRLSPLAWRLRRCLLAYERETVLLAEAWACLLTVAPELAAAPDRRQRMRETIDELVAESWLITPDDARAYDEGHDPPLPRRVQIVASAQRARPVGAARGDPWRPELAWAATTRLSPRVREDLLRINDWLGHDRPRVIVPPRERSLELFGPGREDRLHELARSELFGDGRLSWDLLACTPVPFPFVWSPVGPGSWLLVVSGHETFASVRRALVEAPATAVGLVAHGAAGYFTSAVASARILDRTVERILYYGNIDAADLRTSLHASQTALREDLPPVEPARAFYELLLAHGSPSAARPLHVVEARALAQWMPPSLRGEVTSLLVTGLRLAQEWVGYELLVDKEIWRTLAAE